MRRWFLLVFVLGACAAGSGIEGTSPTTGAAPTTSVAETTTRASTTTTPASSPVCDRVGETPVVAGTVTDDALTEVSGIARSAVNPGWLWAHNDGGSPPRLWAFASDGTVLGHHEVRARNVDWEDMSLGPGPDGGSWIYLADIGDNLARRTQVHLHRFPEPVGPSGVVADVESLEVRYPGDATDAEALIVDPVTGDAFIITKTPSGRSTVLRIPSGAWTQEAVTAVQVATLDLGALSFVTGADISADGSLIAIRTYGDVWMWERGAGESVAEALGGTRCRAPAPPEPQGEAIALVADGYVTVSEGPTPPVYRFDIGG